MTYSKEEKAMWLEDWQKSGKGAWTYAKENGLIPQTFVTWTKKEQKAKTGFVEIQTKFKPKLQTSEILIEKGDIRIHLPFGSGINELSSIIECLQAAL
ncbi:MAG: hypothetical protein FWD22_07355 [Treponema sp.]|nr:hypothetical protein [Treponema sp.]